MSQAMTPSNESFQLDPETRARVAPQFDVDALEKLMRHLDAASRPGMLNGFLLPEFSSAPPRPNAFWVLQGFGKPVLDELLAEVWQPFWDVQPDEMLEDPHSPYPGRTLARRRRGWPPL
jgi:hypothetical protein